MNKIPIDTLLNPQNNDSIDINLEKINNELIELCSKLPNIDVLPSNASLVEILKVCYY